MREEPVVPCALCGRGFPPRALTRHHCKPKAKGGTTDDVEMICGQCHGMIHATYTNETLAKVYATIEQLRAAPELQAFVKWVRKQPPSKRSRNATRRRKL